MSSLPYKDRALSIDARVDDLLARMTLEEKLAQLGGMWSMPMLTPDGIDRERAREMLTNGIGHISRHSALMPPEQIARTINTIQGILVEETRLSIPAIFHEESCAGFLAQDASCFPMPLALASSFDPTLIEKMTRVIRRQMLAVGARHTLAPVVDVVRDARWGRCEETFGEDTYLIARMAVAYVRGLQTDDLTRGVICTGKHFTGYSASEGGLNWAPAHIGHRELLDVFIPPYAAMIAEANLRSVMNGYQEIDGIPCGASTYLLNDILRGELGFSGTVVSDYETLPALHNYHNIAANPREAAKLGLTAGIDVELPQLEVFGKPLREALDAREVSIELVNRAVRRILRAKFELGLFEHPYVDAGAAAAAFDTPDDRALARELSAASIVLLKNEKQMLPLRDDLKRIALIGPTADSKRLLQGDYHYPSHHEVIHGLMTERGTPRNDSSEGKIDLANRLPNIITPLAGLRAQLAGRVEIRDAYGCNAVDDDRSGFDDAIAAARWAELVVLCVGGKSGLAKGSSSGEFNDRATLKLPGIQEDLVAAVAAIGTPMVLVVLDGRPLALTDAIAKCEAAMLSFPPGEEGGSAIADVLTGRVNPAARLPVSMPRDQGQMPLFYAHKPSGQRSQFWGDYADLKSTPLFPFGYGLSYSTFKYSEGAMGAFHVPSDGKLWVAVKVTSEGPRDGVEVVQLYLRGKAGSVTRPVKQLKGFARVPLKVGEKRKVTFTLDMSQAAFHGRDLKFAIEPGDMEVMIGASSEDIRFRATFRIVGERRELRLLDVKPTTVEIS
ncbi:MAG TPA: glycoside hydrolase family 3 N-terminal domain-containing protein [Candidatus Binataceae bacterium]|nr:glycoside hydrolase family 3 N-terminal domain-containing protein [Candidatus Binataceae bacterium]